MERGPFLSSGDVELLPLESRDAEFLRDGMNHAEVRTNLMVTRKPLTLKEAKKRISKVNSTEDIYLLISYNGNKVGVMRAEPGKPTERNAEGSIWVHPRSHGSGVGTAATRLMADYGFDELNLHKWYVRMNASNEPAQRICEELGFEQEARLRDHAYQKGSFQDVLVYGLLESDWNG